MHEIDNQIRRGAFRRPCWEFGGKFGTTVRGYISM